MQPRFPLKYDDLQDIHEKVTLVEAEVHPRLPLIIYMHVLQEIHKMVILMEAKLDAATRITVECIVNIAPNVGIDFLPEVEEELLQLDVISKRVHRKIITSSILKRSS